VIVASAGTVASRLLPVLLGVCGCSADAGAPFPWQLDRPLAEWQLPARLHEISGLALAADGRLFGHDDEHAVVYEIDAERGALVKAFALAGADGTPVAGDFEGLAIVGADFYLVTSGGVLYRTQEGADGARVPFTTIDAGAGPLCEIEGLAADAGDARLLIACKSTHDPALAGRVVVLAFDLVAATLAAERFEFDEVVLAAAIDARAFNPSSVEVATDGRLVLLSGRQRALALLDRSGTVVAVRRLDRERHAQPEGLALTASGRLIVADEGAKKKRSARLTVYVPS
jgi:uncharacterized protein YjiK